MTVDFYRLTFDGVCYHLSGCDGGTGHIVEDVHPQRAADVVRVLERWGLDGAPLAILDALADWHEAECARLRRQRDALAPLALTDAEPVVVFVGGQRPWRVVVEGRLVGPAAACREIAETHALAWVIEDAQRPSS